MALLSITMAKVAQKTDSVMTRYGQYACYSWWVEDKMVKRLVLFEQKDSG